MHVVGRPQEAGVPLDENGTAQSANIVKNLILVGCCQCSHSSNGTHIMYCMRLRTTSWVATEVKINLVLKVSAGALYELLKTNFTFKWKKIRIVSMAT